MSNVLKTGVAWLQSMRTLHLSEPITYQAGQFEIPNIPATPGATEFAIETSETFQIETDMRDWIVQASDLVLFGRRIMPERGQRIVAADGIFEVMAPGNVQPYRLDPTGQQLRIHTKKVSHCAE